MQYNLFKVFHSVCCIQYGKLLNPLIITDYKFCQ